jgi:hypothetical protein
MAIVPQTLFCWQAVESSSEIQRLALVLRTLPDEPLMERLEARRKGKRDDNPVRPMWNSLIAAIIFRHESVESLRRELARNAELRQVCGFELVRRVRIINGRPVQDEAVPSKDAYSRFIASLCHCTDLLGEIFTALTARLGQLLPDFGRRLAADGKAIVAARRDDPDASVGTKRQGHPDGEATGAVTAHWLGYKLHMLSDATYELPVGFAVTGAAVHESPRLLGLVEQAQHDLPQVMGRAQTLSADMGYDDAADKAALYDSYGIVPLIPARDLAQGQPEPLDPTRHDTIYLSPTGQVLCRVDPFHPDRAKQFAPMQHCGFERDRQTHKFRCPRAAYGIDCHNREACRDACRRAPGDHGRTLRVALERDRRRLGPLYGHSYRFADLYKMRTSVERLFARLDHLYGFERHHTCGLKRMQVRVNLALIAMQATAVGWIVAGQAHNLRRLRPAA